MRTPRDDKRGGKGRTGWIGMLWLTACALCISFPAYPAHASEQVPFEQAAADLASPDAGTRLRAVQLLRTAAFPEAAIPLAPLLTDPQDEVQFAAIAAELNIFLVEPVVAKKRVALVVEVRNTVQAEPAFTAGPNALGARLVPVEVVTGLRVAARDQNPRVAIEALYAFGALAAQPGGAARRELLRAAGPDLAAFIGSSDPAMRYAAVRVLGRVFAKRAQDEAIEPTVGDAVITALNDGDRAVKAAAMRALGSMRYERGLQALTDLFTYYRKGDAAETAFDALARIAHPTSVPLFIAQLASPSAALRVFAIEGLARSGDAAQLPAIQTMLEKERDASVTLAGAFASIMLGNASTDQVSDVLVRPRMREQARRYLVEIAPGRTRTFAHQLLDSDTQIRVDVIDALGLAADPAALAVVEPLTADQDPQVAMAAERAASRLRQIAPR